MIKQYKTALIFVGIIVVLLAAMFGMKMMDPAAGQEEQPLELREQKEIFAISRGDIKTLAFENSQDAYTFAYEGENAKVLNRDFAQVDPFKLDSVALEFTSLKAEQTVFEETQEFAKFGLSAPQATVVLTGKDGKATKFLLGNETANGGYYFAVDGSPAVYVLPSYKGELFLRKLDYYREGTSIEVDTNLVTRLEITGKNGNMTFVRNDIPKEGSHNYFSIYSMTAPYQAAADGNEIAQILTSVSELSILDYVEDDAQNLTKYGFDQYVITITQGEKTDRLYIGNEYGDKVYIRINDSRNIYGVSKGGFHYLTAQPLKFISSMVYIKNLDTVQQIDYQDHLNGTSATFRIKKLADEKHEVTINGKPIDEERFKAVYTEIIGLTMKGAISYVPQGEPVLTYTFTFTDGTSDTVQYYQVDERRLAISVNGAVQFYLNRSDLVAKMDTIRAVVREYLQ